MDAIKEPLYTDYIYGLYLDGDFESEPDDIIGLMHECITDAEIIFTSKYSPKKVKGHVKLIQEVPHYE